MISIPYRARRFPARLHGTLSGQKRLETTWAEIAWAAITVGRREWADVIAHGEHSLYEAIYRLLIVRANLKDVGGRLAKTNAFNGLDPSEKGAISYFLGLTAGKLFAARLLGVPYVMHLSVYQNSFQPITFRTNERPDLFGFDRSHNLLVLEAKGRSNSLPKTLMAKAKRQTISLRQLGGIAPASRVASASYFASSQFQVSLEDPNGNNPKSFDVDVSLDDVIRDYYRGFVDWINTAENVVNEVANGRRLRVVDVPLIGIRLGVDDSVVTAFSQTTDLYTSVVQALPAIAQPLSPKFDDSKQGKKRDVGDDEGERSTPDPLFFYGPDGIAIWMSKDWEDRMMKREPSKRDPLFTKRQLRRK